MKPWGKTSHAQQKTCLTVHVKENGSGAMEQKEDPPTPEQFMSCPPQAVACRQYKKNGGKDGHP